MDEYKSLIDLLSGVNIKKTDIALLAKNIAVTYAVGIAPQLLASLARFPNVVKINKLTRAKWLDKVLSKYDITGVVEDFEKIAPWKSAIVRNTPSLWPLYYFCARTNCWDYFHTPILFFNELECVNTSRGTVCAEGPKFCFWVYYARSVTELGKKKQTCEYLMSKFYMLSKVLLSEEQEGGYLHYRVTSRATL